MAAETPNLRYFDPYAACMGCGKAGHGIVRGDCNQSYGSHCTRCANKRLKASKAVRDAEIEKALA